MPVTRVQRNDETPMTRLTHLADIGCAAIEAADGADGNERGVILLADTGGTEYGSMMFGFDDDDAAIDFLLRHVEGLCRASGRPFHIVNVDTN